MTKTPFKRQATRKVRLYPEVKITDAGAVEVELPNDASLQDMIGVKTRDAANGLLVAALSALGKDTEPYRQLMAVIFAEVEPRDAVEAPIDPTQRLRDAPRCAATAKRTGKRCQCPSKHGWTVCRLHGAGGGAPSGAAHPNYRHGMRTKTMDHIRRLDQMLRNSARELVEAVDLREGDS